MLRLVHCRVDDGRWDRQRCHQLKGQRLSNLDRHISTHASDESIKHLTSNRSDKLSPAA